MKRQLIALALALTVAGTLTACGDSGTDMQDHNSAAGSGSTVQEVNLLLKQFEQARDMMKSMMGGGKRRMRMPFGRMPK